MHPYTGFRRGPMLPVRVCVYPDAHRSLPMKGSHGGAEMTLIVAGVWAIGVLRGHHPRMIERAQGSWRNGKWADFDPVRPPDVVERRLPRSPADESTRSGCGGAP